MSVAGADRVHHNEASNPVSYIKPLIVLCVAITLLGLLIVFGTSVALFLINYFIIKSTWLMYACVAVAIAIPSLIVLGFILYMFLKWCCASSPQGSFLLSSAISQECSKTNELTGPKRFCEKVTYSFFESVFFYNVFKGSSIRIFEGDGELMAINPRESKDRILILFPSEEGADAQLNIEYESIVDRCSVFIGNKGVVVILSLKDYRTMQSGSLRWLEKLVERGGYPKGKTSGLNLLDKEGEIHYISLSSGSKVFFN
jgi:hypothetical protein